MTSDFAGDKSGTREAIQLTLKIAEVGEHLPGRLVTLIPIFTQSLLQDGFEFHRNVGQHFKQRRWLLCQDGCDAVARRLAQERWDPSHHFVENYTKAPDIRARVHVPAAGLFRRHIAHRAYN